MPYLGLRAWVACEVVSPNFHTLRGWECTDWLGTPCEPALWATSVTSQEPWPWNCESPKEVSKGHPRHFQNHVVWSHALKCSAKSYVTGPSTKCYINESLLMHAPHRRWIIIYQWLWDFKVLWSPDFVLGLPPRSDFWKQSKWPWNMIHLMPRRSPHRLCILFAFTYSIGPSSAVWSELEPAPPFQPIRVLEVRWVTSPQGLFIPWTMKSSQGLVKYVIGCWTHPETTSVYTKRKMSMWPWSSRSPKDIF